MVLVCANNIKRWLYPRFFVYMSDYPEKCVLQIFPFNHYNHIFDLSFIECSDMHEALGMLPLPTLPYREEVCLRTRHIE
jgi:hypothetical protein